MTATGPLALSNGSFTTPEEAFANIATRALPEKGGLPLRDYIVVCKSDTGPDVIITTPPVTATFSTANPKQVFGDKKAPVHLVPPALVLEAAPNMRDGRDKYGAFNWRDKKVEAMTYVAAIQRHLYAYIDGEDVDQESASGATHLGAIAACVGILADARNMGNLIDNRPIKGSAGDVIRRAAGVVIPPIPKEAK